jgi:hypothetical protein
MYVHLKYVYGIGALHYLAFYFFIFMHKLSQTWFQEVTLFYFLVHFGINLSSFLSVCKEILS